MPFLTQSPSFHLRKCLVCKLTVDTVTYPPLSADSVPISNRSRYVGLSSVRVRLPLGIGHIVPIGTLRDI